ncbi:DUF2637 domain-containing protein [Streptomyces stelliscabiei]|uniref:DUF2637 domain-containing protein n=1 Tax=Streptomyces stelliscabiei TaxID=146820 RepID=UPI0029B71ED2|nr:DUF2637 domain-containing protein [Streptomyces stelliscabiei]MDX2519375.1 DUF2637 domain-containing protein [Streptomyces stelliscabiei]MDX2549695.1 DUF2637 domain-containing protein [Streptomyces stelliscabiei]MDX2616125.1 DUF2637 domain-containing protein [Streptomyces stelliscabiei]MDX2634187.1 DUF2637 domain-containing protein [Streptomyces stelliscabiei]MDX2664602.1 DUF2637 domain-containing protein [Streptomyces stelliscabiei]
MTTPHGDRPTLTRLQRRLIVAVAAGAAAIAGIGFIGSYAAVRALARAKGFGKFAMIFPIGIDAGILVLLALDLLLTWLRIPFPLLRHTAWLLTAATIAFNGAAAWPDPIGTGMHSVIPLLFVVVVEAARHAIGRTADITAGRHMDSVRMVRWLLDPLSTFRLWRRMKLWELRSYDHVIQLEQSRLIERARLRARYGWRWRSKAPVPAVMALRLTRYGRALAPVAGVLDIEHTPAVAERAGTFGSAPVLPELPPVSREPDGEPVSPLPVSREPVGPAHEPTPEPSPRAKPAQSFGEHAAAAIEITLLTPPAEPPAHPAPGEPSPEPDREPAPEPPRTQAPTAGEAVLTVLRAFAQDDPEPVSVPADPPRQPAPTAAPAPAPVASIEQREADAAWLAIEAAARRTTLSPAHAATPALPREPQVPGPVSRPVSPEPTREPNPEPAREPEPGGAPVTEPPGEPGPAETDEIQQQITTLASRLRNGDQLTKTTAAQLLGVSPATAGRRLKDARARIDEGTGFYP